MDVVQENLRSLCVWKYDQRNYGNDDILWWDYAVLWDENCGVNATSNMNFTANCSFAQMDKVRTDGSLSAFVRTCIADSGGYGYKDGKNTILQAEMNMKYNKSIYAVPTVRINEFLIHGNIDCEHPVTPQTCTVLAAICAGFIEGTQPDVCLVTPSPTEVTCSLAEKDCVGTCFGNYEVDLCGMFLAIGQFHSFLSKIDHTLNKQEIVWIQYQVHYGMNVSVVMGKSVMQLMIVKE